MGRTRLNDLLYRCTAGNQSTYTMTNEKNQLAKLKPTNPVLYRSKDEALVFNFNCRNPEKPYFHRHYKEKDNYQIILNPSNYLF